MLKAQIEAEGPEHVECVAILTKISLLQVKGKHKASVCRILKIYSNMLEKMDPAKRNA